MKEIVGIIHRPVFLNVRLFGDWILSAFGLRNVVFLKR
jgi:hypothetical protein